MMLSARELARIFFAGESDEARIVTADTFYECEHLGAASIAIGVFDGVHRGHQELIEALVRDARAHGCKAVVVTFDPDPDVVVSPSPAQKLMTTAVINISSTPVTANSLIFQKVFPFPGAIACANAHLMTAVSSVMKSQATGQIVKRQQRSVLPVI